MDPGSAHVDPDQLASSVKNGQQSLNKVWAQGTIGCRSNTVYNFIKYKRTTLMRSQ